MLQTAESSAAHTTLPDTAGRLGLILVVIYAVALVLYDRYVSTRPSLTFLCGHLESLRESSDWPRPRPDDADWTTRQQQIDKRIDDALARVKRQHWWQPIQTSVILSVWREAHRIERLVWREVSYDDAWERLLSLESELGNLDDPNARQVATRIARRAGARGQGGASDSDPHALLQEALRVLHEWRDTTFESLADLQVKSVVLSVVGLSIILVASAARHRELLFLLGAVGGFLSRLARLLRRRPSFTDYGASSARLLLAPVAGALSAWIGVLLVQALTSLQAVDANVFKDVWDQPLRVEAGALAFVFGFSERFFDRAVSAVGSGVFPDRNEG